MSVCGLAGNKGSLLHTGSKPGEGFHQLAVGRASHRDVLLTLISIFSQRLR